MMTFFGKKKITADRAAQYFVNTILDAVEEGFPEVAGFIRDTPEFVSTPQISDNEYGKFLMIVVAGNFTYMNEFFQDGEGDAIKQHCMEQLAPVFDLSVTTLQAKINDYRKFMAQVNHPSKNTLYAMSKAVFFKYDLNQYQEEYFRNLNTPNPILLKSLDEVMRNFIWDWSAFTAKYRIQVATV